MTSFTEVFICIEVLVLLQILVGILILGKLDKISEANAREYFKIAHLNN